MVGGFPIQGISPSAHPDQQTADSEMVGGFPI
jgi:hypothetical protein